ncbi:hypothetical protein BKA80DRAFT_5028 [Phyllosticta citrichinensis]
MDGSVTVYLVNPLFLLGTSCSCSIAHVSVVGLGLMWPWRIRGSAARCATQPSKTCGEIDRGTALHPVRHGQFSILKAWLVVIEFPLAAGVLLDSFTSCLQRSRHRDPWQKSKAFS